MFAKFLIGFIELLPKRVVWLFAKKYVAGSSVEAGKDVSLRVNADGIKVTADVLGEFISTMEEADATVQVYLQAIESFDQANVEGGFSIKPSFFGLLLDKEVCYENMRTVIAAAVAKGFFVRIDMEHSSTTSMEIELYLRLKEEFPKRVGLVLQAYLRRTMKDIMDMLPYHTEESPLDFRLCKGIYKEKEELAFKGYGEIRENFLTILEFMLANRIVVGIATHDKYLVEGAYQLIEKYAHTPIKYEFQMLYGVTPALRKQVIAHGETMRLYIPFGEDWYAYSMRRFKENPNMMKDIIKAIFVRS